MEDTKCQYVVSIIIPVHNTAPYLKRCVESVRHQLLKDIEIILVDNKSEDMSPAMCDEYAKIDSRIKVLHLSEAGLSIARNAGIKVATAPYVGFVDSDDYIDERMYLDLLCGIETYHADVAYCTFCYEYTDGRIEHLYTNSGNIIERTSKEVVEDIISEKISSSSCTKLFKKELFDFLLFPEGVFWEDHAMIYQLIAQCNKVVWVDRDYYFYLQREGSICHTVDKVKQYHFFLAEYPRLEFIKKNGLFAGEERAKVVHQIVQTCFCRFTDFMKDAKLIGDRKAIKDMRTKMKRWLDLSSDEIDRWVYRRVRKITYMWLVCYWKHYRK
ncbi:glycosyltransferase family 2 protein [Bacteroides sp.]|uniref:glycosyltransferase family 2 protein n=1 Tax=Bacteroides sp. TaxID=29523 RepID=UPI00262CC9D1|nr:glycosyltransferase family 2 protein [Bacteroides sp.]MDD3036339.1 glycosyltransferase family 2 protein [Bacteroides sp.]